MYTQTTVRARNLRKGDAIVGRGWTVIGTEAHPNVLLVHVSTWDRVAHGYDIVDNSDTRCYQPNDQVRVARKVRS